MAGSATPSFREEPDLAVVGTAVVDERVVEDNYWAVVVAADVVVTEDQRSRWFVEVGLAGAGDGYVVVSAPAVVAGPLASPVPRPGGPSLRVPPPDDEAVATVEAFLGALLAGTGDVSRYLAPGVDGQAVVPAPFASVRVERTALVDGSEGRAVLRVEAVADTPSGAELILGYEVRLAQRGGRWEVESFTGAPTLAAGSTPVEPATTTPGMSSPATTSTTATTVALEPGA